MKWTDYARKSGERRLTKMAIRVTSKAKDVRSGSKVKRSTEIYVDKYKNTWAHKQY